MPFSLILQYYFPLRQLGLYAQIMSDSYGVELDAETATENSTDWDVLFPHPPTNQPFNPSIHNKYYVSHLSIFLRIIIISHTQCQCQAKLPVPTANRQLKF